MAVYQTDTCFFACGEAVTVRRAENGETHAYSDADGRQLSRNDLSFSTVYGGMNTGACDACHITMASGRVAELYGGGASGTKSGKITVRLLGGTVVGYLYGAGDGDEAESVDMTVDGGAVRWGIVGGGKAVRCGRVEMHFPHILSANVTTGTQNPDGVQEGGASVDMTGGTVLNLNVGGAGQCVGDVSVRVTGGRLEKQIADADQQGEILITLWDGIFVDGSFGRRFPMLPERAKVEYVQPDGEVELPLRHGESHAERVLDTAGDAGKLTLRFFELRDPEVPRDASLFPEFIGDGFYVAFPDGGSMLVDTGLPYAAPELVARLQAMNVEKIDKLVITHAHSDHLGSAPDILRVFRVGEIIMPPVLPILSELALDQWNDMVKEAARQNIPLHLCERGDAWDVGRVHITVMNPAAQGMRFGATLNDYSLAMQLRFGESTVMLGADMGEVPERELVKLYGDSLRCDVLKLSHHAIVYQSHPEYLLACRPKIAVAHSNRPQGVFAKTTRQVISDTIPGTDVYLTGIHGAIRVRVDDRHGVDVATEFDA